MEWLPFRRKESRSLDTENLPGRGTGCGAGLGSKGCARDTPATPDPKVALLLWRPWSPAGEFGRCDGRPAEPRPGGEGSPGMGRLTVGRPTAYAGHRTAKWEDQRAARCGTRSCAEMAAPPRAALPQPGLQGCPVRASTASVRGGEAV